MSFKVGDKIVNIKYPEFGIGTVIRIDDNPPIGDRSVVVTYSDDNNTSKMTYNMDGTQNTETDVRIRKLTKLERALL